MSNLPIRLVIFGLACVMIVYFVVHRISRAPSAAASAASMPVAPNASPVNSAPSQDRNGFAFDAMTHSLAACQPHLRSQQLRMPQIDVSQLSAPQEGHIKLNLSVDEYGAVTEERITAANFGLPSEQEAVLGYSRTLSFYVPRLTDCRGRHMEVLGDVFEQRDRTGRWATLVRLYPKYALDAGRNLITRE